LLLLKDKSIVIAGDGIGSHGTRGPDEITDSSIFQIVSFRNFVKRVMNVTSEQFKKVMD
jgi:hypothetical protein